MNLDVDSAKGTLVTVDPRAQFTGVRLVFGSQHTVEQTIGAEDDVPTDGGPTAALRPSRDISLG